VLVDLDAASRAEFQAGSLGEGDGRAHAGCHDDHVGLDEGVVLQLHLGAAVGPGGERGGCRVEMQHEAVGAEVVLHRGGHLAVQGRHDLVRHLHDLDRDAALVQVLRHLEADVAGADDHGVPDAALAVLAALAVDLLLDDVHVPDPAEHVDRVQVDAGERGPDGVGAGGEGEFVVRLVVLLAGAHDAGAYGLRGAVDRDHLDAVADVDVQGFPQALGGLEHQATALLDRLADVVRQPAVGERDVVAALEHDDLGELVQAARPRRDRHPCRYSADDDDLHDVLLPDR